MTTDKRFIDRTGMRYGNLVVISLSHSKIHPCGKRRYHWLCKCDCGKEKPISSISLTTGDAISCGCEGLRIRAISNTTHGQTNSRAYSSWRGMVDRCTNPNHSAWKNYGGRGIEISEDWLKFENFLRDMGQPASGMTLERNNGSEGYSKSNCRWATRKEQARNKRNNRVISFNGQSRTMAEWAELIGLRYSALQSRLSRGWGIEKALTTPHRASS